MSVTEPNDVLEVGIGDLVRNFRSALVAVVPAADRAMLTWTDGNQHYDWERLAACMFDVFVRSPISVDRHRIDGEFEIARYDIDLDNYVESSWIACEPDLGFELALIRFLSEDQPFDTVQAVEVDPQSYRVGERRTFRVEEVNFAYIRRGPNSIRDRVTRIEAND